MKSFILVISSIIFCGGISDLAFAEYKTFLWRIIEVKVLDPSNPKMSFYKITLEEVDTKSLKRFRVSHRLSAIDMNFFAASLYLFDYLNNRDRKIYDLVSEDINEAAFTSYSKDPRKFFSEQIKLGKLRITQSYYVPPRQEEMYEKTVTFLSEMKCPDFSYADGTTASEFANKLWEDPQWLSKMNREIQRLSNGQIELREENVENFSFKIRGMAAYLILVRDNSEKMRLTISTSSTPINCYY